MTLSTAGFSYYSEQQDLLFSVDLKIISLITSSFILEIESLTLDVQSFTISVEVFDCTIHIALISKDRYTLRSECDFLGVIWVILICYLLCYFCNVYTRMWHGFGFWVYQPRKPSKYDTTSVR